ncbi:MAG: chemotaxis protein CheD [Thermodesulfobacteriota bacterium]
MSRDVLLQDHFVKPGYVYVPAEPTQLRSVAASGIVVTMYDRRRNLGGMGHYIRPVRERGLSTAVFAAPALAALTSMFLETGSEIPDLETHFYGGAVNRQAAGYAPGVSEENVRVGLEILAKMNIGITSRDVGGERARKIVFHTGTGEIMLAKVEAVRASDWYPALDHFGNHG